MSSDEKDQRSKEERIAACPIHQWADIDDYLERAAVPGYLWEPFHDLVLARGELPKNYIGDKQNQFGKKAVDIVMQYEIPPVEAHSLKIIFSQLISQWIISGAKYN